MQTQIWAASAFELLQTFQTPPRPYLMQRQQVLEHVAEILKRKIILETEDDGTGSILTFEITDFITHALGQLNPANLSIVSLESDLLEACTFIRPVLMKYCRFTV